MSNVAPPCSKWVYYTNPVPPWATTRAVELLAQWNADPALHNVGDAVYETGGDGRSVRYLFEMHPPDPQNPNEHRGVEVQYCADSVSHGAWLMEGIDVSDAQGVILWQQVKDDAAKQFAFIKATEGLPGAHRQQANFAANWAGASAAGIVKGAYHFFDWNLDPVKQADFHAATVGKLTPGDIGSTLDCEPEENVPQPTTPAERLLYGERVVSWCARVGKVMDDGGPRDARERRPGR